MRRFFKTRAFRIARRLFRWLRIATLLVVLVTLCFITYFNEVGLPRFFKQRFVESLRHRGANLEFQRMRLRWYRGIVVENATLQLTNQIQRPVVTAREAVFDIALSSLASRRLELKSVTFASTRLVLHSTNFPEVVLQNIQARVLFPATNRFLLERFDCDFRGTHLQLTGGLTNYASTSLKTPRKTSPTLQARQWNQFNQILSRIQLAPDSNLQCDFSGDLLDPTRLAAFLKFQSPSLSTPWFSGRNLQGKSELGLDANTNIIARKIRFTADALRGTNWMADSVDFLFSHAPQATNLAQGKLDLTFGTLAIPATNLDLKIHQAQLFGDVHFLKTNPWDCSLEGTLDAGDVSIPAGSGTGLKIAFEADHLRLAASNGLAGAWSRVPEGSLRWRLDLRELNSAKLATRDLRASGQWQLPLLSLQSYHASLYDGSIDAVASVNAETRAAKVEIRSSFDPQRLAPLLTAPARRWLNQFTWAKAPSIHANAALILPDWTQTHPDWRRDVQPTLEIDGHFDVAQASFRGIQATSARSDFVYSNQCWLLPHLHADRPEGTLDFRYFEMDETRDYEFQIVSSIDPNALRPVLSTNETHALDLFVFHGPPRFQGTIAGRWMHPELIALNAEIVGTNFSFNNQSMDKLSATLQFTNEFFRFTDIRVDRADRFIKAPQIDFDAARKKFYFTNVYGTIDPMIVTRAIGEKTAAAIEPYRFETPPTIRLNGTLTLRDVDDADMHFKIEGNQFNWTIFHLEKLAGDINWTGESLRLTNMQGRAYSGEVKGDAQFDFALNRGADYKFDLAFAEVSLPALLADISPSGTNRMEGNLYGRLNITSAKTYEDLSWHGSGRANLRDGFLWSTPIFGVFSRLLETFHPGLGRTKAKEASGNFTITNSVLHTDDLEIRAAAVSLKYRGTVDFEQRVDARVEAEVLKEAWGGMGRLVTLAFTPLSKLFEYKVTGSLKDPHTEPLHIPKWMLVPLHPFHAIKQALPEKPPDEPVKFPPAP